MADQFSLCLAEYKTQLATLNDLYFPAAEGLPAGWQVSEDDTTPLQGADYAIVLKPGTFAQTSQGVNEYNEWGVITVLYMKYPSYSDLWPRFRIYRNSILELRTTHPLKNHGIEDQTFRAREDAGYLINSQGDYTQLVVQTLECIIKQRRIQRRQF